MDKFKILTINAQLSFAQFKAASVAWDKSIDCMIEVASDMSKEDIQSVFDLTVKFMPEQFAKAVLSNLAELEATPQKILEYTLNTGDSACLEAVCLRSNLPLTVGQKCELLRSNGLVQHKKSVA